MSGRCQRRTQAIEGAGPGSVDSAWRCASEPEKRRVDERVGGREGCDGVVVRGKVAPPDVGCTRRGGLA